MDREQGNRLAELIAQRYADKISRGRLSAVPAPGSNTLETLLRREVHLHLTVRWGEGEKPLQEGKL